MQGQPPKHGTARRESSKGEARETGASAKGEQGRGAGALGSLPCRRRWTSSLTGSPRAAAPRVSAPQTEDGVAQQGAEQGLEPRVQRSQDEHWWASGPPRGRCRASLLWDGGGVSALAPAPCGWGSRGLAAHPGISPWGFCAPLWIAAPASPEGPRDPQPPLARCLLHCLLGGPAPWNML